MENKAPSVHGNMSSIQRLESALCGFLLFDLWALVATKREKEYHVGRGRMQIAGQTRRNLQYVALTTALLTIGKPREWDAWRQSHGLNEIHIERHFGQLRGQASNSELTARDYWYAVADNSRKMAKKHESPKNHVKPTVEEPLLEPEFLR